MRGEPEMAGVIASADMSVFVMDYDYNAPSAEHLAQTHEPFFQIVREAQPDLPIVIVSSPSLDADPVRWVSDVRLFAGPMRTRCSRETLKFGLSMGKRFTEQQIGMHVPRIYATPMT